MRKKKPKGCYKEFLLSGFYGWVNRVLTENAWNCLFFVGRGDGSEVCCQKSSSALTMCVSVVFNYRIMQMSLSSPWKEIKKRPLNIEIYATFCLQWYREYREQSVTKPFVHFVFYIRSLSLIKCSKWETYISSGKPTSFCSSHWTGSLSLTRIPHFKDFHGKDFRLRMSFSVLFHFTLKTGKLLHIKCVDLIID